MQELIPVFAVDVQLRLLSHIAVFRKCSFFLFVSFFNLWFSTSILGSLMTL